jgi:hypothetical protein
MSNSKPLTSVTKTQNTAALFGTVLATLAFIIFGASAAISAAANSADAVVNVQIVVEGIVVPLVSLAAMVCSIIGLRRSKRLGSRRLATFALVVSAILLVVVLFVFGAALALISAGA